MKWVTYEEFVKTAKVLTMKDFRSLSKADQKLLGQPESSGLEDEELIWFSASHPQNERLQKFIKKHPEYYLTSSNFTDGEEYSTDMIINNEVHLMDWMKLYLCKGDKKANICNETWLEEQTEDRDIFEVFNRNGNYFDEYGKKLD